MDTSTEEPPPIPARRPLLVWAISIYYGFSAVRTILVFALILSGTMQLDAAQKQAFESHSILDYGVTLLIAVSNLVGAVLLFFLKKAAFYILSGAFCIGLGLVAYAIIARNLLGALSGPGLFATLAGWGISLAVLLYAKRLIERGVLK